LNDTTTKTNREETGRTMKTKPLNKNLSVAGQVSIADMTDLAAQGFKSLICNRPDGESNDQPTFAEIAAAAKAAGLEARHIPVSSSGARAEDAALFAKAMAELPGPILAFCRSGARSTAIADMSQRSMPATQSGLHNSAADIVIVGAGAGGIAVAASLLARKSDLDIIIIDPAETHYYQPGWTLVGAGVFEAPFTARPTASLIPAGVRWIKAAVSAFEPDNNCVVLEDASRNNSRISYKRLIVSPGLKLNWAGIEGLSETLGKNGVTSNYRYDLAPYTWDLVQNLKGGKAIFTQPPMPIKCAGAPQKALYLSGDHWHRTGALANINIDFYNAGAVLFGVAHYVPALMEYIRKYKANLHFGHTLTKIDGPARKAWFTKTNADGTKETVETNFDMIHVVPPQQAPDFIRSSPLADAAGWVDVDQATLRHKKFANIWSLGDVMNAPNAKTAAAARKQAPVVAHNVLKDMGHGQSNAAYDGYGSCPLTVERGKIVFAEFGYGGKLLPTFPLWLIDGQKPSKLAWLLKERILPPVYWNAMLKGKEWYAKPDMVS
jgi:sulfide:quinone oxidoreductase